MQLIRDKNEIVNVVKHFSLLVTTSKFFFQNNQKHDNDDDLNFEQLSENDEQQIFFDSREQNYQQLETIACHQQQIVALFRDTKRYIRFKQSFEIVFDRRSFSQFSSYLQIETYFETFDEKQNFRQITIEFSFVIVSKNRDKR